MISRKKELIEKLDELDKRSGLAETVSDILIVVAVNQFEQRVMPLLPEWVNKSINDVVNRWMDEGQTVKLAGGETPPDPDPDA